MATVLAGAPGGLTRPVLADAGPAKKGPEALLISGMPPTRDEANGVWVLVPDLYINDRSVYTHNSEELYLTMSDCGYFQISDSATGACTGFAKDSGKGIWLVDDAEALVKVRVRKKSDAKPKKEAKKEAPVDAKKDLQPTPPPTPPPTPTETQQSTTPTKITEAKKTDAPAESGAATKADDSVKPAAPVNAGDDKAQAPAKLAEAVKPDAAAKSGVATKASDAMKPAASANPGAEAKKDTKRPIEMTANALTNAQRLSELSADDLAAADRLLKRVN